DEELSDDFVQIITEELNVKTLEFAEDASQFIDYEFKPQMRILGPKYGKLLGAIRQALASLDGAKAMAELKETGTLTIDAGGEQIALTEEELLISTKQMEGFVSGQDRGVTVVLDTNLTPELLEEGFVREVISKVQTMRKEAGFEVTDHIRLTCTGSDKVETIVGNNKETIGAEVLADEVLVAEPAGYTKEWKINGEEASLGVEKV
ncbi:MAG: isoleucine--tRNA ligase, partial [Lachnospiraceae bacterium]|nr:isoleucine--tRNA ligase [Lachnospiraceae bacterium]